MFCCVLSAAITFAVVSGVNHLIHKPISIAAPSIELRDYDTGGISILPGDVFDYAPYIENTGEASVYAVIAFTCHCYAPGTVEMQEEWDGSTDDSIPAFIIYPHSGWELKDTAVKDGEIKRYYAYTSVLEPGESTPPLCDSIQYNLFTLKAFSKMSDEELNFGISCNAGNSDMTSIDGVVSQSRFGE
ncbi:MAG: hypothetical protein IJ608_05335 [Lachnospiraceae bacterium]|nr:hypothetical protein [Lachnospiraceae bacterium]